MENIDIQEYKNFPALLKNLQVFWFPINFNKFPW